MTNFVRKLWQDLAAWRQSPHRKPLVIRGARQVGKTTLVRQFGAIFPHYIELNLEKKEYRRIFEKSDRLQDILNAIYLQTNTPKTGRETLLFLDEIQEAPEAIRQLRYFYEEAPELHVIAAGSLLEFALGEVISFPVGRVEQWVLHPLDFEEFLTARGLQNAVDALNQIPVPDYAHETLLRHFHEFAVIGGMPEVVRRFIADQSMANLPDVFGDLWQSWLDDVEKYAESAKERNVIRYVMQAAAGEKDRISFAGFASSSYGEKEVREAFRTLDMARIILTIYPTTSLQPPPAANLKRRPRLQFLDTGLLNYLLGIQADMIGIDDLNAFHSGKIIQHLATQEAMAQYRSPLYKPMFWVRENANSNAEVDMVLPMGKYLIPVEVKSGKQGRLRSLHEFMDRADHPFAIRLLANRFSVEEAKTPGGTPYYLVNLPYYLAAKLKEYGEWMVGEYG
jgi:predicted AAA+ superfamily ATPase